nr:15138_t:CDS:2 [Entrophospora candida]
MESKKFHYALEYLIDVWETSNVDVKGNVNEEPVVVIDEKQ